MKKLLLFYLVFVSQLQAQTFYPNSNGEFVKHSYYSLSYNEVHEQAEWLYYKLSHDMFETNIERTDNYRYDSKVSSGSSFPKDYYKSGYDRGHLAPAGDMKKNLTSMSESFYMSNISPQDPSFNRGVWKKLESLVRTWAHENEIHVVVGGVLKSGLKKIGESKVSVPKYFYKIVYDQYDNKMIGFVIPNEKVDSSLEFYVFKIDDIESLTGIDFFPDLNDNIENSLESDDRLNVIDKWDFGITKTSSVSSDKLIKSISSQQCLGIAKSTGNRCRNKTKNNNGYCYLHQSQSSDYVAPIKSDYVGRCNATTKKGTRCKRNAASGSRYCWQHG